MSTTERRVGRNTSAGASPGSTPEALDTPAPSRPFPGIPRQDRSPAAEGGPVIRRLTTQTDWDKRIAGLPTGVRAVQSVDANTTTLIRVDAVAPPNVTVTGLKKATGDEMTAATARNQQKTIAGLLASTSLYGVERGGSVVPDTDQVAYPAEAPTGADAVMKKKADKNMAMAFHDSDYAFGHYTANVVKDGNKNLVDNEHFTVENSLATMFGSLGASTVPYGTHVEGTFPEQGLESEDFWSTRRDGKHLKGQFQNRSEALGYAAVDNINFRPTVQKGRAPSALGEQVRPGAEQLSGNTATKKSDAVAVEQDVTLQSFYNMVKAACARLKLETLWDRIRTSMETVRDPTGFAAADLHLNSGQRGEFLKLALTMNDVAGLGFVPPPEFANFHKAKSPVSITAATVVKDEAAKGFVRQRVAEIEPPKTEFVIKEGENFRSYNEITTALIAENWDTVFKTWIVSIPA